MIFGPNNDSIPLMNTSDIGVFISTSTQATYGTLYWADGEAGTKSLSLIIKPHADGVSEIEKRFVIGIMNVTGIPSSVGNGDISFNASYVTLVVRPKSIVIDTIVLF